MALDPGDPLPPLHVLLVDDNADDRALAVRALEKDFPGVAVREITDAHSFERALAEGGFDVVITDYQLKWSDGLAVLRAARERLGDVPTVMFTGTGNEEVAVEAMKDGLDDYVIKSPTHYIRLPAAVATTIEHARRRRQLRKEHEARTALLERLVAAQEEERRRIAGDIHDDSIQIMTATGMRIEVLRRLLSDKAQLAEVGRLEATVGEAIARLRHLVFELLPPVLDQDGLASALRQYLSYMEERTGIACRVDNRLDAEPGRETRIIMYRVLQEALANVRKHANASSVEVLLEQREGGFLGRVRDDGRGFEPGVSHLPPVGHFGLASMQERAALVGGWCCVESEPGKGTTVECWLPLEDTAGVE